MAVEARHLNLFPSQLIPNNRDVMNPDQGNASFAYNTNTQMGSGLPLPSVLLDYLLPFHPSMASDSLQAKTSIKADSGLTYNLPAPRKRLRDSLDPLAVAIAPPPRKSNSFLGDEISLQIQQQQLEIDQIIAQHNKKIRLQIEERQKQHARLLVSVIGEGALNKLKEKDDQIQRMGKVNLALQEKVKSLYLENQLWRDLAQTNEATATSLRINLEQVLEHVTNERLSAGGCGAPAGGDDAESCCGSNDCERDGEDGDETTGAVRCTLGGAAEERRMLAGEGQDKGEAVGGGGMRMCRKCGERQSCVLLLPCRHLCLCTHCGSALRRTCPVCNSTMNATVHVNMS